MHAHQSHTLLPHEFSIFAGFELQNPKNRAFHIGGFAFGFVEGGHHKRLQLAL
jgi:hypothetical protein